jgi:hypothetical protein
MNTSLASCCCALAAVAVMMAAGRPSASSPDTLVQTDVYVSGEDGYHTYRIPSVIVTPQGTLLAFAEARRDGRGDTGDIDLVVKRSADGGRTWSAMQIVGDNGPNTVGNPCPVIDRTTGTIWLLTTHNLGEDREKEIIAGTSKGSRTVWVMKGTDDGLTWSAPVEITARAKRPDWTCILPAAITPFDPEGQFDADAFERLLERLYAAGVHGIYLCGTTGEGMLQPAGQRKAVTEVAVSCTPPGRHVIVHVGAGSPSEAVDLAAHAAHVGAHAISSLPPLAGTFSFTEVRDSRWHSA